MLGMLKLPLPARSKTVEVLIPKLPIAGGNDAARDEFCDSGANLMFAVARLARNASIDNLITLRLSNVDFQCLFWGFRAAKVRYHFIRDQFVCSLESIWKYARGARLEPQLCGCYLLWFSYGRCMQRPTLETIHEINLTAQSKLT